MTARSDPNEPRTPSKADAWERHELEQLRRLAKLSLAEKLDWLEQAQRLADQLAQGRREPPASPG